MIRVLVVDDHDFVRTQLVALLDRCAGIQVVGQCSAGEQVVGTAARVIPDVVVMDVQMGAMSGLVATRELLVAQPSVRVLVLTASPLRTLKYDAPASGAHGLLLKSGDPNDVVSAVRTTAAGGCWWPRELTDDRARDRADAP